MQVVYQSEQFLDKNKDYVVPEQNELLNESQCPFVSNLFPITEESKSAKFNSIGTRFKVFSTILSHFIPTCFTISCKLFQTSQYKTLFHFLETFT